MQVVTFTSVIDVVGYSLSMRYKFLINAMSFMRSKEHEERPRCESYLVRNILGGYKNMSLSF